MALLLSIDVEFVCSPAIILFVKSLQTNIQKIRNTQIEWVP